MCGNSYWLDIGDKRSGGAKQRPPASVRVSSWRTAVARMLWLWVSFIVTAVTARNWTDPKVAGKVCRHIGDSMWTCRLEKNCTKSIVSFPKRQNQELCKTLGPDTFACCQPEGSEQPAGTKSKQRCEEYGKHVFQKVYDPYLEEFLERDRCITVELLESYSGSVEPREYPHMAYIGVGGVNKTTWFCEASLISERFVISAARCVRHGKRRARWVRIGDHDAQSVEDDMDGIAKSVTLKITKIYKYDKRGNLHDIALFQLEDNVKFSDYIRPLCLYTEERLPASYGITTGWGWEFAELRGKSSRIMQKTNVTIVPCDNTTGNEATICAGGLGHDSDVCKGDLGAPLQLRIAKPYCMYGLMGIFSHCEVRADSTLQVYTRVSKYITWIESLVWPFTLTNKL